MKRVAATSAYVRSWLPSAWKRALQRLLHFLLRLSMFPRRLLQLEGDSGARTSTSRYDSSDGTASTRRWLRVTTDTEPAFGRSLRGPHEEEDDDEQEDALFFAAADAALEASTRSRRSGLTNTGNTCFVNAVVQCLFAIPGFVDGLEGELLRVLQQELDEPAGGARTNGSDERETRKHATQLQLAETLLDLLKGLSPDEEEELEASATSTSQHESTMMNGHASSHATNVVEHASVTTSTSTSPPSSATGKKRKRPMTTSPGDYSAVATTKRLRRFLEAASKCSDLVAAQARRQEQQDAEELLLFLLDSLHELLRWTSRSFSDSASGSTRNGQNGIKTADFTELRRLVSLENECLQTLKKCVVTDPDTYNTTVAYLGDVRWHRYLKENSSFITDMFTGQIVRGSQCCSCANLTCLHQEFRVLSLSIDASQGSQTLDHCLETHRRLEDLVADNQVFCDGHCQGKTSRRTQVLLQRAPRVLVIQLQRFKQTSWRTSAEKVACGVEFPINEPLDLTSNMFLRDPAQPVQYELQAVCAHLGDALDAGHYIAYSREKNGLSKDNVNAVDEKHSRLGDRWNKFDDDCVTSLDAATVRRETQSTAYMLFYALAETTVDEADAEPAEQNQELNVEEGPCTEDDDNI